MWFALIAVLGVLLTAPLSVVKHLSVTNVVKILPQDIGTAISGKTSS
jgi:hypothetical protein